MDAEIAIEFIEDSKIRVDRARNKINHCLEQLRDDDIWWIPAEGCNCIGVIIQHLLGNLRQWIISGVGGAEDVRDRPREFRIEDTTLKAELQRRLNEMLDQVVETYSRVDPARLLDMKTIQGLDASLLSAIYRTMTHMEHHVGQIVYITRMRLGDAYQMWRTASK